LHTLDSCRIEKAFRHFGHDITDEDHVLEAGLGFAVRPNKGDFIGREAVLRKQEAGAEAPHGAVPADRPRAAAVPQRGVVRDGKIVSIVTSGNYGHHLGGAIGHGLCAVRGRERGGCAGLRYEIEIRGRAGAAEASLKPMYDPKAERVRCDACGAAPGARRQI
jgi:glycine cleavage system aminomethyltransferase T